MEEQKNILDYISPKKSSMPSSDYFEGLANQVIKNQRTKIVPFYKKPAVWIGSAAAVAIGIVFFTSLFSAPTTTKDPLLALQEVSAEEIMDYLHENIDDIDVLEIEEVISDESLEVSTQTEKTSSEASTSTPQVEEVTFDNIDTDDILNYLNKEGIDPSELEDDNLFL